MQKKRAGLLLGAVLTLVGFGLPLAASEAEEGSTGSSELRHRTVRDWDLELPAERLIPVGQGFDLTATLGRTFKVGLEGTSLLIDTDGDGEFDVTAESPAASVTFTGDEGRRYSVRLLDRGGWRYAPGGTLRGKVRGETIQLIDQNLDGDYSDIGEDAVIVGRGKIASFLSRVIAVDGALVELEIPEDGRSIGFRPYTGAQGTLRLGPCDTKAKVMSAIVRSEDGRYCFDMAKVQEGLEVPAGEYRLVSGVIGLGESRVSMSTGRSVSFEVPSGGAKEISWGGPVRAEFAYRQSDEEVELHPDAVWYYGKHGEEYIGWNPIGKSPQFTFRNKKTGREIAQAYFPGTC
ncbi:MAG: hypothetical protein ACYTGJ_04670 [Planctomycetota bacterium]